MDEFLRQATTDLNLVSAVDIWDLVLVLALSAVLSGYLPKCTSTLTAGSPTRDRSFTQSFSSESRYR